MRITEAEQEARRMRMLHTAYELFCAHGIDHVSLKQIAQTAQVSLNSIFRYFDTKTKLLQQTQIILWAEIANRITEDNQEQRKQAQSGLAEMRILLDSFESLYQNHSHYIYFAYEYKAYLLRKKLKLPQAAYDRTLQPVQTIFMEALARGRADGSIVTTQPASDLFLVVWGLMRYLVEQTLVHQRIYEGENPWSGMFSVMVKNILEHLQRPF